MGTQGRDPRYIDNQRMHFNAHFAPRWTRLRQLTSKAIARYQVERMDDGISTVTLYKELVTLSRFLRWAKREKLLEVLPEFERPTQTTEYQVPDLRRGDVLRLLAKLPDRASHPKHHPAREFATLLWSMALRLDEARRLEWRDVNLEAATLTVRAEIDKAGRQWLLPMTAEALALLTAEAQRPHKPSDRVFPLRSVRGSFDVACEALAKEDAKAARPFPRVTPHHLRHAKISELANGTRRLASVQYFARHLSIATTARYVRAGMDQAREMLDEMAGDFETGVGRNSETARRAGAAGKKAGSRR